MATATMEQKKAPAKKRTRKPAESVAVREVEPAGRELITREPRSNEPLSSGSMVDEELGAGMAGSELPGIDLAASEPALHAPGGDGSVSAEAGGNGAVSEELASDIEEDLRFGREFMNKYRETFRALAK